MSELKQGCNISKLNIFFKYFIMPWTLEDIIWKLRYKGNVISTMRFADTEYKLIRDKKGKYYW